MTYATLAQFEAAAEFFKAGSIVPRRILKTERRYQHRVRFGCDSWAVPAPGGYIVAVDSRRPTSCAIRITGMPFGDVKGCPYIPGGTVHFIGNQFSTDAQWLERINDAAQA